MIFLVESGVIYVLFFVRFQFLNHPSLHRGPGTQCVPSQLVQVIMSLDSVNASVSRNEGLAFAATVYQYISSLIVASLVSNQPDVL